MNVPYFVIQDSIAVLHLCNGLDSILTELQNYVWCFNSGTTTLTSYSCNKTRSPSNPLNTVIQVHQIGLV